MLALCDPEQVPLPFWTFLFSCKMHRVIVRVESDVKLPIQCLVSICPPFLASLYPSAYLPQTAAVGLLWDLSSLPREQSSIKAC